MNKKICKNLILTVMSVSTLFCSCSDDDYEYGALNDTIGEWQVSSPSAQLAILVDEMPADSFFPAEDYGNFQTDAVITEESDAVKVTFQDGCFTELFKIPNEIKLQKGDDYAYTSASFDSPIPLSLSSPVSVERYLPTLGNVLQSALTGVVGSVELPESLKEYLKNFDVMSQQIGGMELEAESWYFAVEMQHGMDTTQAVINLKVKLKGFSFYGAEANLINMVLPMLVESDLFQQLNGFNLKVTLNLKKK